MGGKAAGGFLLLAAIAVVMVTLLTVAYLRYFHYDNAAYIETDANGDLITAESGEIDVWVLQTSLQHTILMRTRVNSSGTTEEIANRAISVAGGSSDGGKVLAPLILVPHLGALEMKTTWKTHLNNMTTTKYDAYRPGRPPVKDDVVIKFGMKKMIFDHGTLTRTFKQVM